jgi:hypothetical protein
MVITHNVLIEAQVFQKMYANKKRHSEPEIKKGNMVYLSTKNISMPKGRASKLVPRYVRPYKVTKVIPSLSN